jgi:hypothetical protein
MRLTGNDDQICDLVQITRELTPATTDQQMGPIWSMN